MKKHRIAAGLLLPAMLLAGCGSGTDAVQAESTAAQSALPEEKILVTLGDSISAGYGLEDPETERYSALLQAMLTERDGISWNDCNYAVSGDDSSDLIERLNNGRAIRLPAADVIILYFGANNLLGVYTGYLQELAASYQSGTETGTEPTETQIPAPEEREAILKQLDAQVDANIERLAADLEEIYSWIRQRNADAEIYVLNVYNPYSADISSDLTEDEITFRDYAQERIDRVNNTLSDFTTAHSDLIPVDIAAVCQKDPMPVLGSVSSEPDAQNRAEFLDPHPTPEGQKIIAEAVFSAMNKTEKE